MDRLLIPLSILLIIPVLISAQLEDIRFEHLTTEDGLSGNGVYCILQDSKGFMWFGTNNGLNKYDGNTFSVYIHDPDDPHSISYNGIEAIYEDKTGNLWIGTNGGGLNKYDPKTEKFTRYIHDSNNPNSLSSNSVYPNAIYEDHKGDLWIGTGNGLSQMISSKTDQNPEKYDFVNYRHDSNGSDNYHHNVVWTIYEDKNHDIWIGTQDGSISKVNQNRRQLANIISSDDIYHFFNPEDEKWDPGAVLLIFHHPSDQDNILTIGSTKNFYKYDWKENKFIAYDKNLRDILNRKVIDHINIFYVEPEDILWAGSDKGLYLLNSKNDQIQCYRNDPNNPYSIYSNNIHSIYKDNQGIFWIGTSNGGVSKYDQKKQKFIYHEIKFDNIKCSVNSIFEDLSKKGRILWLGTRSQGLLKYDWITKEINQFEENIKDPITAIHQDVNNLNILWIGTYESGFYKFDIQKEKFVSHFFPSDGIYPKVDVHNFAASNMVFSIIAADEGNIWIGTMFGLYHFNPRTEIFRPYLHEPGNQNSISDNLIYIIYKSLYGSESVLWIGTYSGGLNKFIPGINSFIHYKNDPKDSTSLNANHVTAIFEDSSGTLWIGTPKGLNKFNRDSETFKQIIDSNKKLSSEIVAIFEDKDRNLWLNTKGGFFKFNLRTQNVRDYDKKDDLHINVTNRFSYHKGNDGKRFMGGPGGFIEFNPDNFKDNSHIPPTVITGFQIFNKPVKPGKDFPLNKSIIYSDKVILSHTQSVFSFEFAALDYSNPEKNKYAYKMDGVDPTWVYTDASRRFATYTQLDPGEYVFRVKGSNNDGIWNDEGTSIKIMITPPWWETNLAYSFYVVLFLALIYSIWRFQLNRERLKQDLKMEHFAAEKLREVDTLKSRFFTNISHEFRTPLTLITGPAKQIIDETKEQKMKDKAGIIYRSADKLNKLVAQLLDLSKIEAGEMNLNTSRLDIISILTNLVLSFAPLAEKKSITLQFNPAEEQLHVYLDQDKVEKIINNILSNAFKFTAEYGEIFVKVGKNEKYVEVRISDSGIGISKDRLTKIFDRFYQVDGSHTREQEGTGVGLALTKELVELHRGEIEVESQEGEGTTFTIRFPLGKKHLKPEEICEEEGKKEKEKEITLDEETIPEPVANNEKNDIGLLTETDLSADNAGKPLLLVVEDSRDVRNYIRGFLENEYKIMEAVDGEDGLNKSIDHIPDIIVSDVMMPKMDGFQLCERLKIDERTSHIPVILLTAKAAGEDKIEGLETGADDYIMKPFDVQELKVRIKNLIEQRKKLREHFLREAIFNLDNKKITSIDKKFLEKIVKVIDEHLSDSLFGVESFASELAIGRTTLHKKVVALVGEAPGELIKRIRLSKAGLLLKNKAGNISEIALDVGFNNPAYFSECFKKQFGVTPSHYKNSFTNH